MLRRNIHGLLGLRDRPPQLHAPVSDAFRALPATDIPIRLAGDDLSRVKTQQTRPGGGPPLRTLPVRAGTPSLKFGLGNRAESTDFKD